MSLKFDMQFDPAYGEAVEIAPDILRVTVNNANAFTGFGTNSYIIGKDQLGIIDPGPEDEAHFETLLRTIAGRPVSHIFVSHTHRDHSPLAARLKRETGATIVAQGPHQSARPLFDGESNALDASVDSDFTPDICAKDGEIFSNTDWSVEVIHTPGHMANHACFALPERGILFSADHVMAWATTIVAPPDGSMSAYMQSLEKLLNRKDVLYFPGHGAPIATPHRFLRGLKTHRKMRERAVLERVMQGDETIAQMVAAIYRDTDPRLHGAAGLSVFAHLEDLVSRGLVLTEGDPMPDSLYRPA
ncbi:MBL fold metallo-hydrolase [Pseudochrobactrum kiredjianiae]|uniref:MBL fold metallo-hydrolase n=1 Tax=Pseudochrobactrum kiredjianiae TaxID=386305 RepID=A0ABW3VA73_9HYPH|nr:MBL fold metallo-hydrolase [Pseudochrobactrum kiredjianiae]MDM7850409.1 MBL fold metallo-hydrolase [Pseudochrobactrum kiredjianiae]